MSLPVPPPGAEHARFYAEVVEVLRGLQTLQGPTQVWPCHSTALPSPARYVNCVVRVSDLDILACSNGSAWIRQDTGAAI